MMLLARLQAAWHALRHGLIGHRTETVTLRAKGHWLGHVVSVSCECGRVFGDPCPLI